MSEPYDLFSPAFFADPFPTLRRLREEEPVHFHPLLDAWILARYADIAAALHDRRFSSERSDQLSHGAPAHMKDELAVCDRFISLWLVFRDPPRHTLLRALVTRAFAGCVDAVRPFVEEAVDAAIDAALAAGEMDVVRDLAGPLPALTIARLLGVPREDVAWFKAMTRDIFAHVGAPVATEEVIGRSHRGVLGLLGYFRDLVAARKKAPTDDLLGRLVQAEEQGQSLTEEELVATCALLLVAGHETTAHFIGNAILALLRSPAELSALRADPALDACAVEELLRYDGPVMTLGRRALDDVEMGGRRIEAGQFVFLHLHAGNHDPARFADPDRLDLRRKDVRQLGFGQGIHHCIGAVLARMEAQIALRKVIERLPRLRLAGGDLAWIGGIVTRGLLALPVAFG